MSTSAEKTEKQSVLIFIAKKNQSSVISAMCAQDFLNALSKQNHFITYLNAKVKAFSDNSNDFINMLQSITIEFQIKFSLNKDDDFSTERRFQKKTFIMTSMNEINI